MHLSQCRTSIYRESGSKPQPNNGLQADGGTAQVQCSVAQA